MSYFTEIGKRRSLRLRAPMEPAERTARVNEFAGRVKPLLAAYEAQTSLDERYLTITRFMEVLFKHPHTAWFLANFPHFRATTAEKCREFLASDGCGPALQMLILAIQARFGL
jgi:hypothetical protein